jgi:hypothetical protein
MRWEFFEVAGQTFVLFWNPESLEEKSLSRRQINEGIKPPRAVFVNEMRAAG